MGVFRNREAGGIVFSIAHAARRPWRGLAIVTVLAGSVAAGFSALHQTTKSILVENKVDVARVREHSRAMWPECVELQQQIAGLKSAIGKGSGNASLQGDLRAKIRRWNDLGC
jgi:hypothetical protein